MPAASKATPKVRRTTSVVISLPAVRSSKSNITGMFKLEQNLDNKELVDVTAPCGEQQGAFRASDLKEVMDLLNAEVVEK